jgi:hypothetical protein
MFEAMGITTGVSLPALLEVAQLVSGVVQHDLHSTIQGKLL